MVARNTLHLGLALRWKETHREMRCGPETLARPGVAVLLCQGAAEVYPGALVLCMVEARQRFPELLKDTNKRILWDKND
ncbi:hypothetical protein O3P69_002006 [Scylla paramamosain]|uniref:Uncharacterized protein n=1 Tax=Scylla paramamosain TaxID=85552 RepID=A0AAW0V4X8_SCYPA